MFGVKGTTPCGAFGNPNALKATSKNASTKQNLARLHTPYSVHSKVRMQFNLLIFFSNAH